MKTLGAGRFRMTAGRGLCAGELSDSGPLLFPPPGFGLEACGCGFVFEADSSGPFLGICLADGAGSLEEDPDRAGESEARESARVPDVKARSRASLSCNDGVTAAFSLLPDPAALCLDRPGAINCGGPLRRGAAGSAGRLCSSTSALGACLTCDALLFSFCVGTDSALFLFGAEKIVFFFLGADADPCASARGICGLSNDHAGAPMGSAALSPDFGVANTGAIPPILRSYEA
jgi:hypothetical protein